jgi:hypothetical protein
MFWTKPYSKILVGPKNSIFFPFFFWEYFGLKPLQQAKKKRVNPINISPKNGQIKGLKNLKSSI